jgi:putative transposase
VVCIENLNMRNVNQRAAGRVRAPRRNVRIKSGLNRSTLNEGYFELRRQLDYKISQSDGT